MPQNNVNNNINRKIHPPYETVCTIALKIIIDVFPYLLFTSFNQMSDDERFLFIMSYNKGDSEIFEIVGNFVSECFLSRELGDPGCCT